MDTCPPRSPIVQWVAAVDAPAWLELAKRAGPELARFLALPELAGIDVRLAKRSKPSEYEREFAARVLGAGKRLRIHTWMGVREGTDGPSKATRWDGRAQGEQLAAAALLLGAEGAGANTERDGWRGPNGFANPKAVDFVQGVAEGLREAGPTVQRIEVGLAVPAWHYKRADLDKDGDIDTVIPAEVVGLYDRKGVMAYQVDDSPSIVEDAELRTALDRARKVWPKPMPMSAWFGVGRVDNHGRVWGDYAAAKEVIADRHAGIDEVVWYDGFDAIDQVLLGHPRHPALVEVLPAVAAL